MREEGGVLTELTANLARNTVAALKMGGDYPSGNFVALKGAAIGNAAAPDHWFMFTADNFVRGCLGQSMRSLS